ncbi:MAG: UDP-N-acetylglucosamine 2-epimerase (non-hydrolyzing) [Bacteroidia bacterium]|nr:UDP-N-acetylglucosamine 2-epimerase (non-hydrolyzing) [Bacteroidia bacterium]NNC85471.1 UDP-N-acetylglucosamine 2-epimerase (non-hydrolyzing) [Bacteroidia bacterium]
MLKILTIVGARPQFIKAAAINRAIKSQFSNSLQEYILHTGQHYDDNMSKIFFDELGIHKPNVNLNIGSKEYELQIKEMQQGIEKVIIDEKPNVVLVYGDTNSTHAGALAGSKMNLPVIHIEAGLRSFNNVMPEEKNRIVADELSSMLFCPTNTAVQNLEKEGFKHSPKQPFTKTQKAIYHCGDVMFDNSLHFEKLANQNSDILKCNNLTEGEFILATVHRGYNTDNADRLSSIFKSFISISNQHNIKIVIPLHPRTEKALNGKEHKDLFEELTANKNVLLLEPVSFLDMIALESNCRMVMTDSGGVQKESFFFRKPCVVLRTETEWVELIENGNNVLAVQSEDRIVTACNSLLSKNDFTFPSFYGDGKAAHFICEKLISNIAS